MNQEKNSSLTDIPMITADQECREKNPETGKTINKHNRKIKTVGSVLAGAALGDMLIDNASGALPENNLETESDNIPDNQVWDPTKAPLTSAGTVNDNMSFNEAFAAAREEVGAGGVFAWHGEYYNTFYEEELGPGNQPMVDYVEVEQHDLPSINETAEESSVSMDQYEENEIVDPNVMEVDLDADGDIDAVLIDVNLDGSTDAIMTDLNQDSIIAEDELVIVHDPESLSISETIADPSTLSVDTNGDQIDDVLVADVDGDQMADLLGTDANMDQVIDESEVTVLNPEAMEAPQQEEVEYSGEVAADMPEDVTAEVLDMMDDDLSNLEDDFNNITDWA